MISEIPQSTVKAAVKRYHQSLKNPQNIFLHRILLPFLAFSLLGLVWAIPMPHADFLGKMNGYLNLATLLILVATIYYLRLSLRIGLVMIVTIWIFSAGVISLERMARLHGWPEMWQVCLVIFFTSLAGLIWSSKKAGNATSFLKVLRALPLGLAWFWSLIFEKLNWRF